MSIPCKMRPVGVRSLPLGYTRTEYLEGTGTQYIDTGFMPDNESGVYGRVENSSRKDAQFCGARNVQMDRWIALREVGCLPEDAVVYNIGYGWDNWFRILGKTHRLPALYVSETNWLNSRKVVWKNLDNGDMVVENLGIIPQPIGYSAYLFAFNNSGYPAENGGGRIFEAAISQGSEVVHSFVPCLDSAGVPCMFDLVSRQPFRNNGTGQFIVGMTLEQVRDLSLPEGGGQLTLSLPYEASFDRLAQTALEQARANGWELTLQYAEVELPAGYIKLDFLESTGTQYINTGYVPDNESGILLDQEKLSAGDYVPMGSRNNGGSDTRFYAFRSLWSSENNTIHSIPGYGWGGWRDFNVNEMRGRQTTKLNLMNSRKVEGGDSSANLSKLPFVPVQPIYMFAVNINGGPAHIWSGRIYEAVISQGKSIAMNFVPCISPDGKLGMYNKIDGTLYENAGTGSFIAGLATIDDVSNLSLPETGSELTISVPADTPDSAVEQLRENNPTWQIAIQYRTDDNEN